MNKYRIPLYPPRSGKLKTRKVFIDYDYGQGIVRKEAVLNKNESYYELSLDDETRYKYDNTKSGPTFEIIIEYSSKNKTEIVKPVPEKI